MKIRLASVAAFAVLVSFTLPARAEPVPAAVESMIRAAGNDMDTVVKIAKSAYPGSAREIDALAAGLSAERAAERRRRLADAGFFDAWSGSGELGVNYTTGNTKDLGVMAGLGLTKDGLVLRHKLSGLIDRRKSNGVLTSNRALAGYELDYKFNDRLYAYGLAGWERNTFAGFSRRFTESVGAGYSVFKNEAMFLDLTAGPAFQQTRLVNGQDDNDTTARAGAEFGWKISDNLTLSERAAILLGSQWTSNTAVTFALNDALSSRASFDVVRENNPLPGRKALDTATRLSLVYGF